MIATTDTITQPEAESSRESCQTVLDNLRVVGESSVDGQRAVEVVVLKAERKRRRPDWAAPFQVVTPAVWPATEDGYQGPFWGLHRLQYPVVRFAHNSHDDEPEASAVLSLFGQPRMQGYLDACGGDPAAALDLYRWNTQISGAFWETLGHLEVVFRNVLTDRLAARHAAAGRAGSWLDDTARELDGHARKDIAKARQRVRAKGKPASDGQTLSELGFGFWRFLLAKRYTAVWPDLAGGFPHAPDRARTTIERPAIRLHEFRNRLAHHERVWNQPLKDRYDDITALLGYIDNDLANWVTAGCRVSAVLATCPIERPHP